MIKNLFLKSKYGVMYSYGEIEIIRDFCELNRVRSCSASMGLPVVGGKGVPRAAEGSRYVNSGQLC